MKIEKVKSKLKKVFNLVMGVLLPVSTLLVSCDTNALVVHAAESYYNKGNTVTFTTNYCNTKEKDHTYRTTQTGTIQANADYEIVAVLVDYFFEDEIHHSTLSFKIIKSPLEIYNLQKSGVSSCFGTESNFKDAAPLSSKVYSLDNLPSEIYAKGNADGSITASFSITGCKVFKDNESMKAYATSGDTSGMIELDKDIDDGVKDPDIGYLHNLQRNSLQSGKQDENGIYEKYSARFTWDDTYPEYDSSYLVEVRGKCAVQTRGFLGFGKTKNYTSDIKNIAKDILYKDLEWIISSQDQYAPFNSFINEHMPTNLVMTGVYGMRDYYFRIYKWSDTDECYHYGPWVNMHYIDDDLWISNVQESSVGDFDDNGNFIVNPDSDYGTGTKKSDGVGVGDTEEDAKKDNDRREEDKKNDDGKLDLSNASISDIWYWFVTSLSNLYNSLGFIPEFFQKIFSFLPTPIYVFLGIGIVVAILLRVLGR